MDHSAAWPRCTSPDSSCRRYLAQDLTHVLDSTGLPPTHDFTIFRRRRVARNPRLYMFPSDERTPAAVPAIEVCRQQPQFPPSFMGDGNSPAPVNSHAAYSGDMMERMPFSTRVHGSAPFVSVVIVTLGEKESRRCWLNS